MRSFKRNISSRYDKRGMNYLAQLLGTILFMVLALPLLGQVRPSDFNLSRALPTSPEAATLGRFGEVPIGYYTGTAEISVPVYTLKEGNLKIPIELRYHSSGNKVEDQASNVGLGWSLEPGGSIMMIINGQPDSAEVLGSSDYAYLKAGYTGFTTHTFRSPNGTEVYPCLVGSGTSGDSQGTVAMLLQGDGQPDIYQYNFPGGYSGKFYMDVDSGIVLIDKSADILFTKVNPSTFTAKIIDGTEFTFGAVESSNSHPIDTERGYVGRTWKLTQILLPNNKTVRFTYTSGYSEWFYYRNSYHSVYPLDIPGTDYSPTQTGSTYQYNKYLDSIITSDAIVKFHMEDRDDLFGSSDMDGISDNGTKSVKRIKSIEIKDRLLGNKIKSFNLGYTYFDYSVTGGDYTIGGTYGLTWPLSTNQAILGKRLKLVSVQEAGFAPGDTPVTLPAYQFEYDESITMPLKTSFARDYWGYYNGKMFNSSMMPNFTTGRRSFAALPSEDTDALSTFPHSPADREVDSTLTGAYLLKKIIYPTGGYTQFDYQIHHYSTTHYGAFSSDHYGAGMRISKIQNFSASGVLTGGKRIKYLLSNNNPSGVSMSPLTFFYSSRGEMHFETVNGSTPNITTKYIWYYSSENTTPFSGVSIGYSRVIEEEIAGNGRKVFTYHNSADITSPHLPNVPNLMNGKLLNEELRNSSDVLVRETNYRYKDIEPHIFTGAKVLTNFYMYRDCNISGVLGSYPSYPSNGYIFAFYPILSKWLVQDTVVVKNYDGATAIQKTVVNKYNIKGQLIEEKTSNSKAQEVLMRYFYPDDVVSATSTMLRNGHRYDKLIAQHRLVNGSEVSRDSLNYRTEDGTQIVQSDIMRSNNGASFYSITDFDNYGPNESLIQFTQDGLKTSIIWDNLNKLPIAEVKNATAGNVAFTSFEGTDNGNWTYSNAGLTSSPRSGSRSYIISGTTPVSKDGLSSGTVYILSYWTTMPAAYVITGSLNDKVIMTVGSWKYIEHEITGVSSVTISGNEFELIDDLRLHPKGAQMTTFTHRPLVGISSQSDAKGQTINYQYDDNLRLKHLRDQKGNIVKSYDYHYQ